MTNIYSSLILYRYNDWEEYLNRFELVRIFQDVIDEYQDKETLTCVIRYILYAYSLESDVIIIGSDWHKNKQRAFEKANVKPRTNLYEELVLLKNDAVLSSIGKWLKFQGNETFETYQKMKDLRSELQESMLTPIKKSSGEIDYSQKFLNAKYALELKQMIKDLESELIQNSEKLKDAVSEIKQARKKTTMGVETFAQ